MSVFISEGVAFATYLSCWQIKSPNVLYIIYKNELFLIVISGLI